MDTTFLSELRACARLALRRRRETRPVCKADGSLVTPADREIEQRLRAYFAHHEPQSLVVGEESIETIDATAWKNHSGRLWVIDPIDGTSLFAFGIPGWGISLGLIVDGNMQDGVVLYPGETETDPAFILATEGPAVLSATIRIDNDSTPDWKELELVQPVEGYAGIIAASYALAKNAIFSGKQPLLCANCAVMSSRLLMRRAVVAYCAKVKLWDIAGVYPMMYRLGIKTLTRSGQELGKHIDAGLWDIDPGSPTFLSQREHILYYQPKLLDPVTFWKNLDWGKSGAS